MGDRPIRVAVVGYGAAGRSFVPALRTHAGFELAAIVEPVSELRDEIAATLDVPTFEALDAMLAQAHLDAVYIATPTVLHEAHAQQVIEAGKHLLLEKPMTVDIERAIRMADAVDAAGRVCVVGHSHGFDLPIRQMRKIIEGGSLGELKMVSTWCYTDWMCRPRRADELDETLGGGVVYRQGAHQFDVLRVLCGGRAASVRAAAFCLDPSRAAKGAYTAFLEFEGDVAATATYSGYGHFSSMELGFGINELGFRHEAAEAPATRAGLNPDDVQRAKRERAKQAVWDAPPHQPFFGVTIATCEGGDIRQSSDGLLIYTEGQVTEINLESKQGSRGSVLDEWYDAIRGRAQALHDARWGVANLEVCGAVLESSATRREVRLRHQIALRA
jgi:phthalate 4,5-cis-dihydrodiol dehydrogenase